MNVSNNPFNSVFGVSLATGGQLDSVEFWFGDGASTVPFDDISGATLRIFRGISGILNVESLADLDVVCLVLLLTVFNAASPSSSLDFRFLDALDNAEIRSPYKSVKRRQSMFQISFNQRRKLKSHLYRSRNFASPNSPYQPERIVGVRKLFATSWHHQFHCERYHIHSFD